MGDIKDNNIPVVSEECVMVEQAKENTDNVENSTVIFDSVHLSCAQDFCNDLMEQESDLNRDKAKIYNQGTKYCTIFYREF